MAWHFGQSVCWWQPFGRAHQSRLHHCFFPSLLWLTAVDIDYLHYRQHDHHLLGRHQCVDEQFLFEWHVCARVHKVGNRTSYQGNTSIVLSGSDRRLELVSCGACAPSMGACIMLQAAMAPHWTEDIDTASFSLLTPAMNSISRRSSQSTNTMTSTCSSHMMTA